MNSHIWVVVVVAVVIDVWERRVERRKIGNFIVVVIVIVMVGRIFAFVIAVISVLRRRGEKVRRTGDQRREREERRGEERKRSERMGEVRKGTKRKEGRQPQTQQQAFQETDTNET